MKRKILVSLMILAAMIMTACGGESTGKQTDTTIDVATSEAATTSDDRIYPDIPEKDFGGAEFTILDFYEGDGIGSIHNAFEFYTEGYNGEILNDAVYDRNMRIQEKYNIVVKEIGSLEPANDALKSAMSGDDSYSICVDRTARLASTSLKGCFIPIENLPYVNLAQPWWDGHASNSFSIGGNLYFTTSDYILFDKLRIYSMFVNKEMMRTFELGNIYDLVDTGNWTFDILDEMSQTVASDLDGDSVMNYKNDRYGLVLGSYDCFEGFFYSMGNRISQKDKNDIPTICMFSDRATASVDKIASLLNNKDISIYGQIATENWKTAGSPQYIFEEGRGLFYQEVLQVAMLLDTDIDYGIIPLPKYDTSQKEYMTSSQYLLAMALAVPKSTPDPEMTGIILEALSADSMYSTKPIFVETVLKVKKVPDERGAEMLGKLLDSINYDVGSMFDWGGLHSLIADTLPRGQSNDFASAYASRVKSAEKAMQKTIDVFTSIESE